MLALKSHKIITGLLLGLLVGLLVKTCFAFLPFVQNIELLTLDYRFRLFANPSEASKDIVIIMIDQASLDYLEYEREQREPQFWPWERFVYADLLDYLRPGQPRAVVFDLNFKRVDEAGDDLFADSIRKSGNVYCPIIFTNEKEQRYTKTITETHRQILFDKFSIIPENYASFWLDRRQIKEPAIPESNMVILPNATLLETPKRLGAANINKDRDGVLRKISAFYKYGNKIFPSLSMAVVSDIISEGKKISVSADGSRYIWWYGPARTYRYIPFSELYDDCYYDKTGRPGQIRYQPDYFKGKIILVGTNAPALGDLHSTPLGSVYPGVEAQATILDNLISGRSMLPLSNWTNWLITIGICLAAGFLLFWTRSFWSGCLATGFLVLLVLVINGYSFSRFHCWMELTPPLGGLFLTFTSSVAIHYFTEGKEKRRIKAIFSKYLAPAVVEEVLKDYKNLKADIGERRELTVLFSDIRGFTSMSESLSPEQVVHLLNEYLQRMVQIIFRHGGTLDKYIGDGIMAFFGAPKGQTDHARLAVLTAREMIKESRELQAKWAREGKPHLNVGVGINTGEMVVGNIGSEQRLDYTVIGDNVNLASRLESLNKDYGTNIIISQSTAQKLPAPTQTGNEQFNLKELGAVKIRGKEKPIVIYEVKI